MCSRRTVHGNSVSVDAIHFLSSRTTRQNHDHHLHSSSSSRGASVAGYRPCSGSRERITLWLLLLSLLLSLLLLLLSPTPDQIDAFQPFCGARRLP